MGAGSPASWELTLYFRTVVAAAGSVAAGSLAPCELTLYRRTVIVTKKITLSGDFHSSAAVINPIFI